MRLSQFRAAVEGMLIRSLGWGELFKGRPGVGRCFQPNELRGYFNDLRSHSRRQFSRDRCGIPILRGPHNVMFYHPVTICQVALGHFDSWVADGARTDLGAFERLSRWLVASQDSEGGWIASRRPGQSNDVTPHLGVPTEWAASISPYSGMAQGEAISVLVRAYGLSGDRQFLLAAQRAFPLLTTPVSSGGVSYWDGPRVSIEESPANPRNTILNGWIFGLFGVRDLWLATKAEDVRTFLRANIESLAVRLPQFDLGWWSSYDEVGHVAKPFYHALHVAQLQALMAIDESEVIRTTELKWDAVQHGAGPVRAIATYAVQRAERLARSLTVRHAS